MYIFDVERIHLIDMGNCVINLFLDKRYKNKDDKYLVRLSVFTSNPKRRKFYKLNSKYAFTPEEYEAIWQKTKKGKIWKEKKEFLTDCRLELTKIEFEAKQIAESLPHFNLETFENIMFGGGQKGQRTINFWYQRKMQDCKEQERFGTMVNYDSSLKSLLKFAGTKVIYFEDITPRWLTRYQKWMTGPEGKSDTTVGIYLRPLRAIFNDAIADKVIKDTIYPFGKRAYQIAAPAATKKALSKEQLQTFYESVPQTPQQEKAKDFWFFAFYCNGINPKDIAFLKWGQVEGDRLKFRREKTKNTDTTSRDIEVFLNARAKEILFKWGTKDKAPESFVFPILTPGSSPEELERQKGSFTRFVSQHLKKMAVANGWDFHLSYGNSRHSFATYVRDKNINIGMISEALGHKDQRTTQIYLSSFSSADKRDLSNILNLE